ncbi:MAG: hypothetical protein AAB488_02175 [Patescibacteria group bacterium]
MQCDYCSSPIYPGQEEYSKKRDTLGVMRFWHNEPPSKENGDSGSRDCWKKSFLHKSSTVDSGIIPETFINVH